MHRMPPQTTTTATTQWINDYGALPKSFALQERLNCDVLQSAITSPYIHQPDIPRYKALINNKLSKSHTIPITYTRSEYGRFWPDSFCSTQMWRLVRWEAVPKEVTDLDTANYLGTFRLTLDLSRKVDSRLAQGQAKGHHQLTRSMVMVKGSRLWSRSTGYPVLK